MENEPIDTKVFNDPIHGSMELHPLLIKIIDTPQFQRLRFIKQLGGVYFVYPGASHNRFEHSIGVGYLAGELAKALRTRQPKLNITDRDILCVQIAGLCHDMGHGPFSHLYDGVFLPKALEKKKEKMRKGELSKDEKLKMEEELKKLEKWKHEKGSCDMLDHLVKENNLELKPDDMEFIEEMIAGPLQESQGQELNKLDRVMQKYGLTPEDMKIIKEMIDSEESQVKKLEKLYLVMYQYGLTPEDVKIIKDMIDSEESPDKKHEKGSCDMLDHLVKENKLEPVIKKYGLTPEDMTFIKEMIAEDQKPYKKWPYEGRTKDKSFLYEIVSNKKNGIDVDKFDYLARDSYHLGIKTNFDFHRFMQFARVCEVDGRKTICTRDKEMDHMYDLFSTRHHLHKRAYQHRVNKVIEHMIVEAFLKADRHIQIKGSGGRMFTLSTAIEDMEAYTKLTDKVFEEILNSPHPELQEARQILQNIVSRKIYKFVGETKPKPELDPKKSVEEWKSLTPSWKETLAEPLEDKLTPDDFEIMVIKMDYGMKDKDPVEHMHFYSKYEPDKAKKMSKYQASGIRTTIFSEQLIRVFCKKTDEQSVLAAIQHFKQWLKTEPDLVGPED